MVRRYLNRINKQKLLAHLTILTILAILYVLILSELMLSIFSIIPTQIGVSSLSMAQDTWAAMSLSPAIYRIMLFLYGLFVGICLFTSAYLLRKIISLVMPIPRKLIISLISYLILGMAIVLIDQYIYGLVGDFSGVIIRIGRVVIFVAIGLALEYLQDRLHWKY